MEGAECDSGRLGDSELSKDNTVKPSVGVAMVNGGVGMSFWLLPLLDEPGCGEPARPAEGLLNG
jgi:hypothetical protein|tara:strand:- start:695 stop:886 length:192 start_codon:yes stop_codon:yes gene_type:complete